MSRDASARHNKDTLYRATTRMAAVVLFYAGLTVPNTLAAQDNEASDALNELRNCRAIADAQQRLACFDSASATLIAQSESGELRVVDKEDIQQTRRGLFGFSLPKLGIFGSGDDEAVDKVLQSEITGVRNNGRNSWLITIKEGSVWQVSSAPRQFLPEVGDAIELEKAAMSSYWVRLNGAMGVKGRRVE